MREIVFDTETTGLNPATGDRMVEIGCVELINRVETGRTFHCYFNPGRAMPIEAEQVHGLSDRFLSDKPLFADRVEDMLEFIADSPLVAHNASFDFGFLNWELNACGRPPVDLSRMIDTLALAKRAHPGAKHSLDALCTRYGIDRSHRIKHGALLDAQLTAQIYVELTGGRQIGLSIVDEVVEETIIVATSTSIAAARTIRALRPHHASKEELERHTAFIEKLEAPLWLEGAKA